MKWLAALGIGCLCGMTTAASVPAGPARAAAIPAGCVAHGALGEVPDVPGDYRCGGLMLNWHSSGPGASPYQIWAGRWLFRDGAGRLRFGSCTFNRGIHPTVDRVSVPTGQNLRRDSTRRKSAYLLWRYRSADNLTYAAMWVVFHYYAGDAAGSNRSSSPGSPLVPSLDQVADYSGSAALEQRAKRLDAEASRYATRWTLTLVRTADGVTAEVRSGTNGVPNVPVALTADGWNASGVTDADGRLTIVAPTDRVVTAQVLAPGSPAFVTGAPAWGDVPQVLITRGGTKTLTDSVDGRVPAPTDPPPTTPPTEPPSTTPPPTSPPTTQPPSTTPPTHPPVTEPPAATAPATTTSTAPPAGTTPATEPSVTPTTTTSTIPPGTEVSDTEPSDTAPPDTEPQDTHPLPPGPPVEPPSGGGPLPQTGAPTDGIVTSLAFAFLIGGVGLLGTLRRRVKPAPPGWGDETPGHR